MKSNVAVIGSRGFGDYALLSEKLGEYEIEKIVSGGAMGADRLAARFARERGLDLQEFLPDYKKHGRGAPLERNKLIVDAADMVVSFWDGESRGTKFTMDYATKQGKPVIVHQVGVGE